MRVIGVIVGAHGLQGAVRVQPLSDFSERFSKLVSVFLRKQDGTAMEYMVGNVKWSGRQLLIKFRNCNTREAAEEIKGTELCVRESERWPLPDGTYYVSDLTGLAVRGEDGTNLGVVEDVVSAGQDVLQISGPFGELLVPLVADWVSMVNLESKVVEIREWRRLIQSEFVGTNASSDDH